MKTELSTELLADPSMAAAQGILRDCVHYGFCIPVCPTYVLLGDERDSPRGRIDLIRRMLESNDVPTAETVKHLDRCLSCNSCMSTCAARVDYMHLADTARAYIERRYRRPGPDRVVRRFLGAVLPSHRRFSMLLRAARMVRFLAPLMPSRLRQLLSMVPGAEAEDPDAAPGVHPPRGPRQRRVLLPAGCVQRSMGSSITGAAVRLLTRHGCEVVVTGADACCGALELHMGWDERARVRARQVIAEWEREEKRGGFDAVVITTSGCGTVIKDYGHLFAEDPEWRERAARFGKVAMDVTEFLQQLPGLKGRRAEGLRIAYHDACSLQHAQKVTRQPRRLLTDAGFVVRDIPEKHFCCGSAGTYNILQPEIAGQLGRRKAAHVESTDAEVVAAGNLGCMVQISRYTALPVVHTVQLLDWASGGPAPRALLPLLRDRQSPSAGGNLAHSNNENAFW